MARLYQIPNWSEVASVDLAEWTYENYKYEEPETIIEALRNPAATSDKTWRLTPDTVRTWMAAALDKIAKGREDAHQRLKLERGNGGELPEVDYNAFRARIAAEGIPNDRKEARVKTFDQERYQKEKEKWLKERKEKEPVTPLTPKGDQQQIEK